ncbi:glutaredoxin family protein [Brevibacillus migulae]|uniref:glutaredoxin family protein n=1 Tax=Brevibacillus migulae TaxID=1644114 RepID=UPI00106E7AB4|nr:glutaredoxin family protein [Brevibacillus migulae]
MDKKTFEITLYGRPGCHLCEQVEERIKRVGNDFSLRLKIVNIESDPALHEKYMFTIPVVEIDGEETFPSVTSVMSEEELRQELKKRSD